MTDTNELPAMPPLTSIAVDGAPLAAGSELPAGADANGQFPNDRRKRNIPVATDRRAANAAKKRKESDRRRLIDPTTCERDYNVDETDFMKAMDRYKRDNRRPFPTWSEVLEVLGSLGYRKVAEPTDLPGKKPSTPSNASPVPTPMPSE